MKTQGTIRAIALTLAFAGATAAAGTAYAEDDPCAGVNMELTDERQQDYGELVVEALEADLQPSDVEIHDFMQSESWSAVYASTLVADDGMFFFEEVEGEQRLQDVWGGWADPSERPGLIEWAEELGAPETLASCFAHVIID